MRVSFVNFGYLGCYITRMLNVLTRAKIGQLQYAHKTEANKQKTYFVLPGNRTLVSTCNFVKRQKIGAPANCLPMRGTEYTQYLQRNNTNEELPNLKGKGRALLRIREYINKSKFCQFWVL
jgi:hypothetical protein